jgi:hypothetical protein
MRKIIVIILILLAILAIGATKYVDNNGLGYAVTPQVVATVPTEPFPCTVTQIGKKVYEDKTNDLTEAHLCYCANQGVSNYDWVHVDDPTNGCFP